MKLEMVGRLSDCLLLNYRTPAASVRGLLPDGLELVTRGPWAYWNVVACRVQDMRPRHLPAAAGVSYFHVAYRLRVQAMSADAQVHRGLLFVRSDADAPLLGAAGNLLSDFKFHNADIGLERDGGQMRWRVRGDDAAAMDIAVSDGVVRRAADSSFATLRDAQEFFHYEPRSLSVGERQGGAVLKIAEVHRDEADWQEVPVLLDRARLGFFEEVGQADDVAFEYGTRVEPLAYRWSLGKRVRLLVDVRRGVGV